MNNLPKSLKDLFHGIKENNVETFLLKGIYNDNFDSMLSEHFDDQYSIKPMSKSTFYAYSRHEKMMIILDCKYSAEEGVTTVNVFKAWRDKELLKALLEELGLTSYEITDRVGARNAKKELMLVKVNQVRHIFDQEEFEAIGYFITTKMPNYDDLTP